MHQGQIGKLCERSQDGNRILGWFQKLRDTDTNGIRYFQITDRADAMTIKDSEVDDSMSNAYPRRPFEIIFIMPTNIQLRCVTNATNRDFDNYVFQESYRSELTRLIGQLDTEIVNVKNMLTRLQEESRCARAARSAIDLELNPGFTYVYGQHTPGGQEFCWRVPFRLIKDAEVGAIAIVETSKGNQQIQVSRVQKIPSLLNHKLVVDFVQNGH